MRDNKILMLVLSIVISLLGTPVLSLAKAGSGYRGGRGFSQSGGMSSNSVGSRGSRTFEQNGFKPIERSTASPGSAATGASHSTGPGASPAPAAEASPVAQPSFFQRNPIMTGIAAGLAGSWIGHMLFGATSTQAVVHDGTGNPVKQEDSAISSSSESSSGLLFLMIALAGLGAYYLYKRRNLNPGAAMTGSGNARSNSPVWVPPSIGVLSPLSSSEAKLTVADEDEFRRLLVEIQTAWSRQDIQKLHRIVTPEMCEYFSSKLAENVSAGVENRVEDIVMVRTEVRESWVEGARIYATVLMQWTARDYVQPLTGSSGPSEPGNAGDRSLSEFAEAWTFVKHQDGTWLLSAIQQSS